MKKVSIYSLLFACALAMNPLAVRANGPTFVVNKLSVASALGAFFLGIATSEFIRCSSEKVHLASCYNEFLGKTFDARQTKLWQEAEAAKPQILAELKTAKNHAIAYGSLAAASLVGAGYFLYKSFKRI